MNGALTGAYVAMYNHMQHEGDKGKRAMKRDSKLELNVEEETKIGSSAKNMNGENIEITFNTFTNDGLPSDDCIRTTTNRALHQALKKTSGIESINIYCTTNGVHCANSLHYSQQAIDINMINGVRIIDQGSSPAVIELQNALQSIPSVIQNKGPYLNSDANHLNHIHFGTNP